MMTQFILEENTKRNKRTWPRILTLTLILVTTIVNKTLQSILILRINNININTVFIYINQLWIQLYI